MERIHIPAREGRGARVRAGLLSPEEAWKSLVEGVPNGLPGPGDEGLDHTQTWGRTYWGGAVFCLVADIAIREQSNNRHSLKSAMRGVVRRGGNITVEWPIERIFEVADEATGLHVLRDTYRRMGAQPGSVAFPGASARHAALPPRRLLGQRAGPRPPGDARPCARDALDQWEAGALPAGDLTRLDSHRPRGLVADRRRR